MTDFKGMYTVTVTPFSEDGSTIDEMTLRRFVEWQVTEGVHGLIPVASTGEFLSLSDEEREFVAATVIDQVDGRVPVLIGAGAESTWDAVAYTRQAERLGASGVLVIPPFYCTPTEDEIFRHYQAIAESASIPVMLYNNPATSNVDLLPPLVARLSEIDNVSYIKESTMDPTRVRDILRLSDGRISVFGGIMGYESFMNGAVGWTAVGGNLMPKAFASMYEHCVERRDLDAASALYVSATKHALNLMGIPAGPPRPPRLPADEALAAWVARVVDDLALALPRAAPAV